MVTFSWPSNGSSPPWSCSRRPRSSSQAAPPHRTLPLEWSTLDPFPSETVALAGCCHRWSSPPPCRQKCFPSQRRRPRPSWPGPLQRDNTGEPRRERKETWEPGGGSALGSLQPKDNLSCKTNWLTEETLPIGHCALRPPLVLPWPASHQDLYENLPT